MSFLDNFQENLEDLKKSVQILSKKVKEDSSQIKRVAKLKYDIATETKNLNNYYKMLGEYHFRSHRGLSTENFEPEEYMENIEQSIARIESLKMTLVSLGNSISEQNSPQKRESREFLPEEKDETMYTDIISKEKDETMYTDIVSKEKDEVIYIDQKDLK